LYQLILFILLYIRISIAHTSIFTNPLAEAKIKMHSLTGTARSGGVVRHVVNLQQRN